MKEGDVSDRLSSGIHGLDEALGGGFIEKSSILVTGKPGTCKTLFCSSFIYAGALNKEPGLYITTEQTEEEIKSNVKRAFKWDIDALERKELIKILKISPVIPPGGNIEDVDRFVKMYINDFMTTVKEAVDAVKAKRVVIDSVSMIEMFIKDRYTARLVIMSMKELLKKMGVTAIFTSEVPLRQTQEVEGPRIEFLTDAVVVLDFVPLAERYNRTLTILKLRDSTHSTLIHPFLITKKGLELAEIEMPKTEGDDENL